MRTEIIAELGINWLGSLEIAEAMIAEASKCGCDYVKTQTWRRDKVRNGPWEGELEFYEKCQLNTPEKHFNLMKMCDTHGIKYLTTLFDSSDYECLPPMNEIKIAGIEATNWELMGLCAEKFKKIYVSTCGLKDDSIVEVVRFLSERNVEFVIMHGVYMYPCPIEQSMMSGIEKLKTFHHRVGYSDHTEGEYASYFAISYGVEVLERHFTISNQLPGIDNKFSCLPDEMKRVCLYRDKCNEMNSGVCPDESFILDNFRGRWSGKN